MRRSISCEVCLYTTVMSASWGNRWSITADSERHFRFSVRSKITELTFKRAARNCRTVCHHLENSRFPHSIHDCQSNFRVFPRFLCASSSTDLFSRPRLLARSLARLSIGKSAPLERESPPPIFTSFYSDELFVYRGGFLILFVARSAYRFSSAGFFFHDDGFIRTIVCFVSIQGGSRSFAIDDIFFNGYYPLRR